MFADACMPTNFRGQRSVKSADGIFGEHHCYSIIHNQHNHDLISRKDYHDIHLNFVSNMNIISIFKLKEKILLNFQKL